METNQNQTTRATHYKNFDEIQKLSIVRLKDNVEVSRYISNRFIFQGCIPNMPGYCLLLNLYTFKFYPDLVRLEDIETVPEDEV